MSKKSDEIIFARLFRDTVRKHFSKEIHGPLTETESKLLAVDIEEKTGLTISFKTLKNYSLYVSGERSSARKENPSLTTLDTLARYVLDAPVTTDAARKRDEGHYPYWHSYQKQTKTRIPARKRLLPGVVILVVVAMVYFWFFQRKTVLSDEFSENFTDASAAALARNAWIVLNQDDQFWERRGEQPGMLQLFTLPGDNWPDTTSSDRIIQNLLVRPIDIPCFNAEVAFRGFVPNERWHQAGLILLEDTTFSKSTLRLSIAYNDYFGGFELPGEIIVQGITSQGADKPEEVLHKSIFRTNESPQHLIASNMEYSGIRIEKRGNRFRFLLANGASPNAAYKEIGKHEFRITPKYIGIFALKGRTDSRIIPVKIDQFRVQPFHCD